MIVQMKKATIIIQDKDASTAVRDLAKLGVMHIQRDLSPHGKETAVLQEELSAVNTVLGILNWAKGLTELNIPAAKVPGDWMFCARHINDLWKRYDQLDVYSNNMRYQISVWCPWGDFDPAEIRHLKQKGISVRFFQVPRKELKNFPSGAVVKEIFAQGNTVFCTVFFQGEFECNLKEIIPPKQGLSQMHSKLLEDQKTMESIKQEIIRSTRYADDFVEKKRHLEKEIEFLGVLNGLGKSEKISYLSGFIPVDALDRLILWAKERKWGLMVNDPRQDDNVPTLIRNPGWVSLIKPVFKLLEIIPGYHELDISLPFLFFFSIFFGMLIGDAGYGLIYLLLTFWAYIKSGKRAADKSPFFLFYILSFCAIIWGLLTGTFFGQAWLAGIYKPLLPALSDSKALQAFCFSLGAIHLTIAHAWRAVLKIPSLSALADLGWVCVLWTAFLLAKTLILGDNFPSFGNYLIILGVILVVFFTNPQRNLFKAVGAGIGTLLLNLMNNFTDVVSYVRLFAVGLAGVAIADTFNAMAGSVGQANFIALLLSAVILLAGHALNIVLGPMSVLVHGVRLNVLEFSGHANVTWSGLEYKPFKED